jgi:hypothetical protein
MPSDLTARLRHQALHVPFKYRDGSTPQGFSSQVATRWERDPEPVASSGGRLCDTCSGKLLSPHAFVNLLGKGLVFTLEFEDPEVLMNRDCALCFLFYNILTSHSKYWWSFLSRIPKPALKLFGEHVSGGTNQHLKLIIDMHGHGEEAFWISASEGLSPETYLLEQ